MNNKTHNHSFNDTHESSNGKDFHPNSRDGREKFFTEFYDYASYRLALKEFVKILVAEMLYLQELYWQFRPSKQYPYYFSASGHIKRHVHGRHKYLDDVPSPAPYRSDKKLGQDRLRQETNNPDKQEPANQELHHEELHHQELHHQESAHQPLAHLQSGSNFQLVAIARHNLGKPVWAFTKFASLCQAGYLGCAATVSDLLQESGVKIRGSASVYGVVEQLHNLGWHQIKITDKKQFHSGDIVYGVKGSHGHIGIISQIANGKVFVCDNSSSSGTLKERTIENGGSFIPQGRFSGSLYVMRRES